jgi:hypothetical protein
MRSHFLEKELITLQHHSSKLVPEWYTLVTKGMKCVLVMLLQSMETGQEVNLSTHHILKGLMKKGLRDSDCLLWLLKRNPPPVSAPVPSHSSSRASQAMKDKKEKKEYIKQMSALAKIFQQQRLENKKIEKLFLCSKI